MARISDSNPTALDFEPIDGAVPEPASTPAPCPPRPCDPPTDEVVDAQGDPACTEPLFADAEHANFPQSEGYPQYNQRDPEWNYLPLGDTKSIGDAGCAMSTMAMAASGLDHQTITPRDADAIAKNEGAMSGNNLDFNKLKLGDVTTKRHSEFTPQDVDKELAAGRPVSIAVHHHSPDPTRDDHWILVTGKDADGTYHANDPASGKAITLHVDPDGVLTSDQRGRFNHAPSDYYRFTGSAVTFARS